MSALKGSVVRRDVRLYAGVMFCFAISSVLIAAFHDRLPDYGWVIYGLAGAVVGGINGAEARMCARNISDRGVTPADIDVNCDEPE
jgi:hypothetical protein